MPQQTLHTPSAGDDIVHRGRIAVDWDGTLIEDNKWPEMGWWLPGARAALHALARMYEEVVIWTLRTAPVDVNEHEPRDPSDQYAAIQHMLYEAGLPGNITVWSKPYKPPAQFYVDNRAIAFKGDWQETMQTIHEERGE